MPKKKKNEAHEELLRAQAWLQKIHDKAVEKGGMVTCKFSQSIEPVASFIKLHPDSAGGICQGLCNNWIVYHAHDGSIWNEVYVTVGNKVKFQAIRIDKMGQLCTEFIMQLKTKTGAKGNGIDQFINSEAWMRRRGVIPRGWASTGDILKYTGSATASGGASSGANLAVKVWQDLRSVSTYSGGAGSYAQINIYSDKGGHAICAYTGGGSKGKAYSEVVFFDPNFGEFYFSGPSAANNFYYFLYWLFGSFYTNYSSCIVRGYGKDISWKPDGFFKKIA